MHKTLPSQAYSTQKIEIAAFVGLQNMLREQPAIAALVMDARWRQSGQPARDLSGLDEEIEAAMRHVQLDEIASTYGRQRAASRRLWRGVHDHSAKRCAAHARIADPYHITDALLQELLRQR